MNDKEISNKEFFRCTLSRLVSKLNVKINNSWVHVGFSRACKSQMFIVQGLLQQISNLFGHIHIDEKQRGSSARNLCLNILHKRYRHL